MLERTLSSTFFGRAAPAHALQSPGPADVAQSTGPASVAQSAGPASVAQSTGPASVAQSTGPADFEPPAADQASRPNTPIAASLGIVPAALLEPAPAGERSDADLRDEAAPLLDHWLRKLGRRENLCRLVIGRLAEHLVAGAVHHRLGFARLGDYARERLGISGRELRSLARVASRLDELPLAAAAFTRGEISWTKLRLVASIAEPSDEGRWIALARSRTAAALQALIKTQRHSERAGSTGSQEGDDHDEEDPPQSTIDGEPAVLTRVACPRFVRALWYETAELARRMNASELSPWQTAETIAAEACATAGPLDALSAASESPALDSPLDGSAAVALPSFAECEEAEPELARDAFPWLDWQPLERDVLPDQIACLADDLASLNPFAVDARLREARRAMQAIDYQTGRLLRMLADHRLYEELGFRSLARYVRERLGFSARKAAMLLTVERRAWHSSLKLTEAYRSGRLSLLAALTILPVADQQTAGAWIERAERVTLRRLADEVAWALDRRDLSGRLESCSPPPEQSGSHELRVQIGAMREQARLRWNQALDGHSANDDSDGGCLRDLALEAVVAFRAPASVAALFQAAIELWRPSNQPSWVGLWRMLEHVRAEWLSQPRHRDPIFERDGWRCAVPGCSSRGNLQDHHLLFRSRGGTNARDNRVTLCAWHHLRGVHGGTIRAEGRAPDHITWQLGLRPGGRPPLMTLVGERYVEPPLAAAWASRTAPLA